MLALIGFVGVFAAVFGGYLNQRDAGRGAGDDQDLCELEENPGLPRKMWKGARQVFRRPPYTQHTFLPHLRMLYEVFGYIPRAGVEALEEDVEKPESSNILSNYRGFLNDRPTRDFIGDSLRMLVDWRHYGAGTRSLDGYGHQGAAPQSA